MCRVILFLIICLAAALPASAKAPSIINHDIAVRLDPAEHKLYATVTMSLAKGGINWPDELRLAAHAEIESVTANGVALPYEFSRGRLLIKFSDLSAEREIRYSIRYDDPVPLDTVGIEDPSYGVSATIMSQGVYLSEASGWHPRANGANNLFQVKVTGPQEMTGVTTGRLVGYSKTATETSVTWQTPFPQETLALAVGPYELHRDDLENIQLLVFVRPENSHLATEYLESIREYLGLYQTLFGPYPYEKFAVVENFYPTGYGLPGWTLLGSTVIRLPFIRTTSLPHEIAHSWWGNAVEIDYGSGNWGEGLATYVADYYLKELNAPQEALEYRRKLLRDYASLVDAENDQPLSFFRGRKTRRDQAIGYGKSAMVFHMLRDLIGDEAFWEGLQNVALEGRGQRYGWNDLRRHFEAVADVGLENFFRQWVSRPGAPQLTLSDLDIIKVAEGWQVSGTIRQGSPLYDLAVPLRVLTETRSYEQVIGLYENQDCFLFTVAEPPRSITVDPDSRLFRKLYAEEIPATINDLRASNSPLVVVAKGSEPLQEASRDLLRGLQWHRAEVVSEAEFLEGMPNDRDLLFLGWPRSGSLQPVLPEEIGLIGHGLSLSHGLNEEDWDVLFTVNESEHGGRVVAYFLPGSVPAAKDVARRISHYGRYSYLLFRNGRNLVKETWEPNDSPLKFFFNMDVAQ